MLVASTVHAEWGFEAETGFVYDSNLSNSDRSADVRDDWAWRSDVSVNNGLQLTRDLRLNLAADVRKIASLGAARADEPEAGEQKLAAR